MKLSEITKDEFVDRLKDPAKIEAIKRVETMKEKVKALDVDFNWRETGDGNIEMTFHLPPEPERAQRVSKLVDIKMLLHRIFIEDGFTEKNRLMMTYHMDEDNPDIRVQTIHFNK